MSLPHLTKTGDLPVGIHPVRLSDVVVRFGRGTVQRSLLGRRLARIHEIASRTGNLARFIVFGSFVTDKSDPNDVDVFMIMDDNFDVGTLVGEAALLYDHGTAQSLSGAACFGFVEWLPSEVNKPPSKIGKLNETAHSAAL